MDILGLKVVYLCKLNEKYSNIYWMKREFDGHILTVVAGFPNAQVA